MTATLCTKRFRTLDQIRAFLEGSDPLEIRPADRDEAYAFILMILVRFPYHRLGRADKDLVRRFLAKATGYSQSQLTRLIARYKKTGHIRDRRRKPPARPFPRRYTPKDCVWLAEVDDQCGPSGSERAANRGPGDGLGSCGSTPCTQATSAPGRAPTSSTSWTK